MATIARRNISIVFKLIHYFFALVARQCSVHTKKVCRRVTDGGAGGSDFIEVFGYGIADGMGKEFAKRLGALPKNSIKGAFFLVENRDEGLVDKRVVRVTGVVIVISGVVAFVNIFGFD